MAFAAHSVTDDGHRFLSARDKAIKDAEKRFWNLRPQGQQLLRMVWHGFRAFILGFLEGDQFIDHIFHLARLVAGNVPTTEANRRDDCRRESCDATGVSLKP